MRSARRKEMVRDEDRPVKPGDVLFVPAAAVHSARNIGKDSGAELATYAVQEGKPLITLVK